MGKLWQNPVIRVGLMTALFAISATALVALTEKATRQTIAENEYQALLDTLEVLIPSDQFDNAIVNDTLTLPPTPALGTTTPTLVYRARQANQPVAAILNVVAPNGYSGEIRLLMGVYVDGSLAGVRVIHHKETPGLGDKIEARRDDWILQFAGLSLDKPPATEWQVKKDGGQFDQFTGATITPRAVVKAIRDGLAFFAANRGKLFATQENTP
ncbi:Electron transport complex protein RnfG [Methylophaga frappieri]|uniref:Ion-translocating oxidoreductase complex subunit G n=1 Tax=Methylophaga frappieri (strain ATCC BAA-2434 / DSM 25690 / JAM7) TaxID=754477 RepID=I1YH69_METFJ|nr:electron transport complex subunit RsxG [Methylophaga frappieri]AFJ02262.1 Electron transport complex protein RnfG [Methylophaga frappieri]